MNALALLNMLATLAGQAAPIIALLQTTASQNRQPTDEEIDALFGQDDAMKSVFQQHIDAAKANEATGG